MAEITVTIGGMSSRHCVMRAKKAVDALPGVTQSDVKVGSATVQFDDSKLKKEDISAAIEKAGYKVEG